MSESWACLISEQPSQCMWVVIEKINEAHELLSFNSNHNVAKTVRRPGSAWTCFPRPMAGFQGRGGMAGQEEMEEGSEGREGDKKEGEGVGPGHQVFQGAY